MFQVLTHQRDYFFGCRVPVSPVKSRVSEHFYLDFKTSKNAQKSPDSNRFLTNCKKSVEIHPFAGMAELADLIENGGQKNESEHR